jgi:hypothetical protein
LAATLEPPDPEKDVPLAVLSADTVAAIERLRADAADWRDFCAFAARIGRERLPAEPETVALYVADLKLRVKCRFHPAAKMPPRRSEPSAHRWPRTSKYRRRSCAWQSVPIPSQLARETLPGYSCPSPQKGPIWSQMPLQSERIDVDFRLSLLETRTRWKSFLCQSQRSIKHGTAV